MNSGLETFYSTEYFLQMKSDFQHVKQEKRHCFRAIDFLSQVGIYVDN